MAGVGGFTVTDTLWLREADGYDAGDEGLGRRPRNRLKEIVRQSDISGQIQTFKEVCCREREAACECIRFL